MKVLSSLQLTVFDNPLILSSTYPSYNIMIFFLCNTKSPEPSGLLVLHKYITTSYFFSFKNDFMTREEYARG